MESDKLHVLGDPHSDDNFAWNTMRGFDDQALRYDAWYERSPGKAILVSEVQCLQPLLARFARPYLEVGTGTGRFAQALGIECGMDIALRALEMARNRGVNLFLGTGDAMPFQDERFGGVLLALTICFLRAPQKVLLEARRVMAPEGGLVLGMLLKGTPWADHYARLGAEGHPTYRTAQFYSKSEVEALLKKGGLQITTYLSTLFQKPGLDVYTEEQPVEGYFPEAGFAGIAAVKG